MSIKDEELSTMMQNVDLNATGEQPASKPTEEPQEARRAPDVKDKHEDKQEGKQEEQHRLHRTYTYPTPTRNEDKLTRVIDTIPAGTLIDSLPHPVQHAMRHQNYLCSLEHAVDLINGELHQDEAIYHGPIRDIYEAGIALCHSIFLNYALTNGSFKSFCSLLDREVVVQLMHYNAELKPLIKRIHTKPHVLKNGMIVPEQFELSHLQPECIDHFNKHSDKCNAALHKLSWGSDLVSSTLGLLMIQPHGTSRLAITHAKPKMELTTPLSCATCYEVSGRKFGCKKCRLVTCYHCRKNGIRKCPECKLAF